SPCSRKKRPSAAISSEVPLNGAIGCRVLRLRISSKMPNNPIERTAPTDGCLACSSVPSCVMIAPIFFALSISPSSSYTNGRQRRRAAHGMTVVSQPSIKNFVLKMLRDVMTHANRAQRQITGGQSLRHAKQIGNHVPVIDREPRASASETSHHFIGDHQDSVFVAELAHAFEISIRRNENAIGSGHGLEDESCNRLRTFELNGLLNHSQRTFSRFPSALDAMIRIEHVHHARNARFRGPSPWIAGKAHRPRSCAVIRAIASDDLVASGKETGDLDGILVGFGSAVGEEESIDIAGSDFGELGAEARADFGRHEGIRVSERCSLLADRLNDARVAVSDVDGHELAVEVDEALPFRCVKINPFGVGDGNGIDLRLGGPFVERVLAGEVDDFFAGHRGSCNTSRHRFLLENHSPQSHRDTEKTFYRTLRMIPRVSNGTLKLISRPTVLPES